MSTERTEAQVRPGRGRPRRSHGHLQPLRSRDAITFDTAVFTPEERRPWLLSHPEDGSHRLMVATDTDSQGVPGNAQRILGYATSSPFRPKPAYDTSIEVTIYLAPDASGHGVGTLLYKALFEALAHEDVHRAYAGIAPTQRSVRAAARTLGRYVGTYREVAGSSAGTGMWPGTRRTSNRTGPTAWPAPARTRRSPTAARPARPWRPPRPSSRRAGRSARYGGGRAGRPGTCGRSRAGVRCTGRPGRGAPVVELDRPEGTPP